MATELVLYDNPTSSNARKVRALLGELRLAYRSVEVTLDDERPEWYRAIHPFGTVPALVDGDLVLVESNTMLRYLADREGRHDLYPRDPARRARVDQLLDVLSLAVRPVLWELELRTHYATAPVPQTEVDAAADELGTVLTGWERLVEGDGYVTGTFSIADIAATARMWLLPKLPIDLGSFPKVAQMLEIVGSRPAFMAAASIRNPPSTQA